MKINLLTSFGLLSWALLSVTLASCEDVITVPLDETDQKPVIEAWLETQSVAQARITLSQPYNNTSIATPVTDAQVWLTDNAQPPLNQPLHHSGNGIYQTPENIDTQIGRAYTLHVQIGSQTYTATDTLKRPTPIDHITIEYNNPTDTYPSIMLWAQEPAGRGDYYRWITYIDNQPLLHPIFYALADDQLVDGQLIERAPIFRAEFAYRQMNVTIPPTALVQVKQLSLTQAAFRYYVQLQSLSFGQGLFAPPPANLPTNFTNGALGLFHASSVEWSQPVPYLPTAP